MPFKPITDPDLPEWDTTKRECGALQDFINSREPLSPEGSERFRKALARAIEEAFPADLKQAIVNKLFGVFEPGGPTTDDIIRRIDKLPRGK